MSPRIAIATYLQTFILLGVAVGGSVAVAGLAAVYEGGTVGPAVSVYGLSIRQGNALAFETLAVTNIGSGTIGSLTIMNPTLAVSARYCHTVSDPSSGSVISNSCPSFATNPTQVQVAAALAPGKTLEVQLTFVAPLPFRIGGTYQVVVVSSNAAQASASSVAVGL